MSSILELIELCLILKKVFLKVTEIISKKVKLVDGKKL